ncbi:hypothetical protein JXB11_02570 [Candidatus Woesearchaeota archaeon]|nr:hypothetical protein [Candidatus Woesearchaeota archaeon]
MMADLSWIFSGEELEFAEKVYSAVPNAIGQPPHASAQIENIVDRAFYQAIERENPEFSGQQIDEAVKEKVEQCRRKRIMETLVGYKIISAMRCPEGLLYFRNNSTSS